MALTRKMLEALNIEDKAVEQIIEAHSETVKGLKAKLAEAEEKAEKFEEVQKELEKHQKDDYKAKYEKEHKDFEEYKSSVTQKEAKTAKEAAAKAYFEGKGITGKNLEIAMRGAKEEIEALELADGKIKSEKALDDLVAGTYACLVVTKAKEGAKTPTPQGGSQDAGGGKLTKDQIMEIKDTAERQKAWKDFLTDKNKGGN